jgi:hypothetical protein
MLQQAAHAAAVCGSRVAGGDPAWVFLTSPLRGTENTEWPLEALFRLPGEADGETRTPDPIITSDVLYQLSYVGADRRILRATGTRRRMRRAARIMPAC